LRERDGLPVLVSGTDPIPGSLLLFKQGAAPQAYQVIVAIEPGRLYVWKASEVERGDKRLRANVLIGRGPNNGSHPLEGTAWDGSKDPLFYPALEIVSQCIHENSEFEWNLKPLLRLQMAYTLLWSGIERFTAFKYHLGKNATQKVRKLAEDPAFRAILQKLLSETRTIFRTDDPSKTETLDPADPTGSIAYYYQLRSNVVHRGKGAIRDHETLIKSLRELAAIFRLLLDAEFGADPRCGHPLEARPKRSFPNS
jgi:hypothetical protein